MRRVSIARTAWVSWAAVAIIFWIFWLASVPRFLQRAADGNLPSAVSSGIAPAVVAAEGAAAWGVDEVTWAWINVAVTGLALLVFSLAAGMIWWQVRTNYGLLTAYVLLLGGSAFMNVAVYSAQLSDLALTAWELGAVVWPLFFPWLYLFPNGRAVPRGILWLMSPLLAVFTLLFLLYLLTGLVDVTPELVRVVDDLQPIYDTLVLPLFVLVAGAQVYRYGRVSNAAEKKQTKWFLFGLFIVFVPTGLLERVVDYPAELDTITFTALPMGIGISILRYRLFDIDVIIRKTAQYAVLSAVLALVYFGLVVLLQRGFVAVSGQESPAAVVISTLAMAGLFSPLRRRVQSFIDRRFYRQKVNAQQVLARFAQTARDEVELEALTGELLRVIQETVQPNVRYLWLREEATGEGRRSSA